MNIKKAQESAKNNLERIKREIPPLLTVREAEFFNALKKSFISPTFSLRTLYDFMDELNEFISKYTPCSKGCDHCCHIKVSISFLEAQYIQLKTGIPYRDKPITSVKINAPCPFLKNRCCAIYQHRPYVCRRQHALFNPKRYKVELCNDIYSVQARFSEVDNSYVYLIESSNSVNYDIRAFFA